VVYGAEPEDGVDRGWFMFYISLFNHSYWILGATLGGIFGSLLPLGIKGIDFAMTALFVVILLEQILAGVKNLPSVAIGVGFSVISLLIFGASDFILPAMALMLLGLTLLRRPISGLMTGGGGTGE
jgi:4-azaleucine resistance transporter AzlC